MSLVGPKGFRRGEKQWVHQKKYGFGVHQKHEVSRGEGSVKRQEISGGETKNAK